MDDRDIFPICPEQHILIGLRGIAFLGRNKTGCHLHTGCPLFRERLYVFPVPDTACTEDRDVALCRIDKGANILQHIFQNGRERGGFICQQFIFLESEMTAGLGALDDDEIRKAIVLLHPGLQNQLRRTTA